MLTEPMKQLLTAFVDGELSPRQRRAVMRLLHQSSEARELVRQLQENAHKLKQLPTHQCEPSLVDEVLAAIAEQAMQPVPSTLPRVARRRWLPYIAASLAASVMIGGAGLLYWSAHNAGPAVVIADNKPIEKPEPKVEKKPEPPPAIKLPNPLLARVIDGTFNGAAAPVIEPQPFVVAFKDLRSNDRGTGHLLRRELDQDQVVDLDVTVNNSALALDHLRTILKARGIKVIADPAAAKGKADVLAFADNFTSDEVTNLMGELAQKMIVSGPKGNNQKEVDSPYKQLMATPADRQKLAKLLGVEAGGTEPKKDAKNAQPDPKRERSVVLLPTAGASSAQVRQFVAHRRPQPGTVQVLIKIRQE